MSDYDNTNTGALFINDKREKDTHPHMRGSINIEGKEYWVSAWTKISKSGQKFQSLAFTAKEQQAPQASKPTPAPAPAVEFDDDLPF